jgi:hypothetical protein
VLYDTTGVLRVTLIARNGVGADTINRFVTVFAGMQGTLNTQIASSATAADGSATITVSLGTPPYSYHWNNGTSDSSITNVVAGLYSVSVSDANGCVYVNDTIYINFVNEIKQVASNVVVKLYPNPAMDIMNITLPQSAEALINFIDASGATVKRVNMKNSSAVSVPVNDLPAGTYLLRITDLHGNFEIASGRFIKL